MIEPSEARAILRRCNALGVDYHALPSADVDTLIAEADARRYRAPKNAPGSRARMFCQYLQRRADSLTGMAREAVKGKNASIKLKRGRRSVWAHNP